MLYYVKVVGINCAPSNGKAPTTQTQVLFGEVLNEAKKDKKAKGKNTL